MFKSFVEQQSEEQAKKAEEATASQMANMRQMSTMLEQVKSQWAQQQKLIAQSQMQKAMIQELMSEKTSKPIEK